MSAFTTGQEGVFRELHYNQGAENHFYRHGHSSPRNAHPDYNIWLGMRQRCNNQKYKHYRHYGGRGIKVCPQWDSFEKFISDMGPRPDGYEIERKNNDGNYEPSNCRWATRKEQCRNHRGNRRITANGVVRTVAEWSEVTGVKQATIHTRLARGWGEELAVITKTLCKH